MEKSKKPYYCMLCGKHYGGLLINVTDLESRTCRKCKIKLTEGFAAFHCKELNKTIWVNKDAGVQPQYVGHVFVVNKEQFEKLTGQKH